jgi:4-hydroxy-4-methyl-2-oxoglutarate aldolase
MTCSHDEDDAQIYRLGRLAVALLGDVLDRLDRRSQVLAHNIRPTTGPPRMVGRAFTIAAEASSVIADDPYARELAAVDAIPPGSVVVIATDGALDAAIWGELLATRALARGAVGVVTDGAVRDLSRLDALAFPTFAASVSANDSFGRLSVVDFGAPVRCAGVTVESGDLLLADLDGVVVVPAALASAALDAAEQKLAKEAAALAALAAGVSAAEVYARFGVL